MQNRYVVADRFMCAILPPPVRSDLGHAASSHALLRASGTFPSSHSTLTASLVLTKAKVMLVKPSVHTTGDVFTAQGPWLGRAAGGSGRIGTRLAHGVGGRCQGTHRLGMGWAKAADGQRQSPEGTTARGNVSRPLHSLRDTPEPTLA